VSEVIGSSWFRLFPDQMPDAWPKAPSGTGGRGERARDRCEVVTPDRPDGQAAIAGPSRARAPSRGEAVLASTRGRGCTAALLCAKWWSWIDSSVPAVPGYSLITSPRRQILQAVLLGGNTGGEKAAGLRSQELGSRRPDPPWRRAESAMSKDRGDGRGRDIDPELQELPSDPEVAPYGVLPPSRRIRC
jgi:hypothetical protein